MCLKKQAIISKNLKISHKKFLTHVKKIYDNNKITYKNYCKKISNTYKKFFKFFETMIIF